MEKPRPLKSGGLATVVAASLLSALFAISGDCGRLRADERVAGASAATDADIRRWIDELDSDDFAVRECNRPSGLL